MSPRGAAGPLAGVSANGETTGGIFLPAEFYGAARHWHASLGVRLLAGTPHGRIGRYGATR